MHDIKGNGKICTQVQKTQKKQTRTEYQNPQPQQAQDATFTINQAAEWEKNESGAKRVFEETMAENTQIWWKTHVQI